MNPTAIFWPMILHALLVLIVYAILGIRRRTAVKQGEASYRQFKVRGDEPASTAAVSSNLMNQFEAPVLFHVVCLALFVSAGVNFLTVVLAWVFVISRYAHTLIHLTGNNIGLRFNSFGFGILVLLVMWLALALHIAGL